MTMTSNVSIANLGNLQPVDLDLDNYAEAAPKSSFRLPPAGRYTLRAPDSFTSEAFSATGSGALSARVDSTIISGEHAGFLIRYQRVSAAPFKNDPNTSWMLRFLKACGVSGRITSTQDLADAVASTAGRAYEAELEWVAQDRSSGFAVKGMRSFPQLSDGTYQSWVAHPTLTQRNERTGQDEAKRVWANIEVKRYILPGS